MDVKGHFLELWGLGKVEGPFEGLLTIRAREKASVCRCFTTLDQEIGRGEIYLG